MTAPELKGVQIVSLKLLPNAKGRLMEVQRADDAVHPGFGQAYITSTLSRRSEGVGTAITNRSIRSLS